MEVFNLMTIDKTNRTVTLTFEEYAALAAEDSMMNACRAAGVDNWGDWLWNSDDDYIKPQDEEEILAELNK